MLFSSTGTVGLLEDVKFMTGTPDDFTDILIKRYLNEGYKLAAQVIMETMDDWEFQGEEATADLVANQREYTFPTTLLRIERIEAKLDGTNWTTIEKLDKRAFNYPLASETDITRIFSNADPFYDPFDRSIFLYSGTIASVTAGLKIWYVDSVTELSADADVPVIEPGFHRVLSLYAARIWAAKHDDRTLLGSITAELGSRDPITGQYSGLLGAMQQYYANREGTTSTKITGRTENYE